MLLSIINTNRGEKKKKIRLYSYKGGVFCNNFAECCKASSDGEKRRGDGSGFLGFTLPSFPTSSPSSPPLQSRTRGSRFGNLYFMIITGELVIVSCNILLLEDMNVCQPQTAPSLPPPRNNTCCKAISTSVGFRPRGYTVFITVELHRRPGHAFTHYRREVSLAATTEAGLGLTIIY